MADETATANTQQQPPAAVGASLSPPTPEVASAGGLQGGNAPPPKGPSDWAEFKAWVRREITFAGEGHTAEERDALNP